MRIRVGIVVGPDESAVWGDAAGAWVPLHQRWAQLLTTYGVPWTVVSEAEASTWEGCLILVDGGTPVSPTQAAVSGAPPDDPLDALRVLRDAMGALVRPDLRGVGVLRIDDPGSSQRRHLRPWQHEPVPPATWSALWSYLTGFGRVSLFCCPGWVTDDGRLVRSRDVATQEWCSLDDGVSRGVADLECHGYSHVDPDLAAWAAAPDRHDNPDWFRELWPGRLPDEPSVDAQAVILRAWQADCGQGTSVVAPGERWWTNSLLAARQCGFDLFNSWEICRLQLHRPTWSTGIGSPYLDAPSPEHVSAGAPTVLYWHDRDMALYGPDWAPEQLDRWRDCGISRGLAFADLARVYAAPIEASYDGSSVTVRAGSWPLVVSRRGDEIV